MSDLKGDFLSLALAGEVTSDDIDDFVDQWHTRPAGLALHEFLGMSRDEYEIWLREPDMLPSILMARRHAPTVSGLPGRKD